MPTQRPQWADSLKPSPFIKSRFTKEHQRKVMNQVTAGTSKKGFVLVTASALLGIVLLMGIVMLPKAWLESPSGGAPAPTASLATEPPPDTKVQREYVENGKLVLSISPDPELTAGKPFGYLFHFTAPFEQFRRKQLSIDAVHIQTGQRVTAVAPVEITDPSPGYQGLERYTPRFALPISGHWRFTVRVDDQDYASVEALVSEPSWEVSPMFHSGSYEMHGIEKKVGFIDAGFIAGKPNKYMWHFWGATKDLDGKFVVKAVKQGDDKLIDVFSSPSLGSSINGADRNAVSMMTLPEKGRWRLLPFVNDRLVESIVVDVK